MKHLFFCGLFVFALIFTALFFGRFELFAYWGIVIGASTTTGTLIGLSFGEMDMSEESPSVGRVIVPVRSKQF